MSLQSLTDPQVDAVRALLMGGCNAELETLTTEPVVRATFGWPAGPRAAASAAGAPQRTSQHALPALCVYRLSERIAETSSKWTEREVTMRIDYIVSATGADKVDTRWPLLQRVWDECWQLLKRGHHPAVALDADLYEAASITHVLIDNQTPQVRYLFADLEQAIYPSFQAEFRMRHRDVPDLTLLPDLSLYTQVYPLTLPAAEQPTFAAEVHGEGGL